MNFEESQRVEEKRRASEKPTDFEIKAASEKKEEALNFLKTRKIFKDLLEGRIEVYKECKDYLLLNVLIPQIALTELVDAKFAAGYRYALETLEAVFSQYQTYEKEYGEMRGV